MGVGLGTGENRAQMAARTAISSPLLEVKIDGARGILFNITGGPDLTMSEVSEAAEMISAHADPDANIIFGSTIDEAMGDQVKISVIATGFDNARSGFVNYQLPPSHTSSSPKIQYDEVDLNEETPDPEDDSKPDSEDPPAHPEASSDDPFDIPAFLRQQNN